MAWKSICHLYDGKKRCKEIIGHTSEDDDEEEQITSSFRKYRVKFVSGLLVKAWRKNRFVPSGHPEEQLEMRTLAKYFVYKHNNSNYNNNKGLTLVGESSILWTGRASVKSERPFNFYCLEAVYAEVLSFMWLNFQFCFTSLCVYIAKYVSVTLNLLEGVNKCKFCKQASLGRPIYSLDIYAHPSPSIRGN